MSASAALAKIAAAALSDEKIRKALGWLLVALLSPMILLVALFGAMEHKAVDMSTTAVELCFHGGMIPASMPAEYHSYIQNMAAGFATLDTLIAVVNGMMEDGNSLDDTRVKAIFYALYFAAENSGSYAGQSFLDCFVTYEVKTRPGTVIVEGEEVETEVEYTVAAPIADLAVVWNNIRAFVGELAAEDVRAAADSVYNQVKYGYAGAGDLEEPYIGADGFCSPVGASWRSIVTSEFGLRSDPFTRISRGHGGIDLGVSTGTAVRAALPGTVTVSKYNAGGYGYYVMIDHGGGLVTLYGHCSQLLAGVGRTVEAGDVIALSGSTGRSTGPHLHFEVRVNGERVNPRGYLP